MSRQVTLQAGHEWVLKALSHLAEIAEEINRSGWDMEDDLNDVLMGFSSDVDRGPSEKADSVSKCTLAITAIGQLLAGSRDHEALLEDQTASARAVAKKCMLDLTVCERSRTKAESQAGNANRVADKLSEKLAAVEQQLAAAKAAVSAHADREERLLSSATECENLRLRCDQLEAAETSLKARFSKAEKAAAAAADLSKVAERQAETFASEVESLKEQLVLATANVSKDAVKATEMKWAAKYAALEEESKSIEPRYQALAKQNKGRIRVLERELSTSEQKQKAVSEELVADMDRSMNRANARIAELEMRVHDSESLRDQLESASTERAASQQASAAAERAAKVLRLRVSQLEAELTQAIQSRSSAEALTAHSNSLQSAEKNASATIATLLSSMGMPARSAAWTRAVSYKPTHLGGSRTLPIVIESAAAAAAAGAAGAAGAGEEEPKVENGVLPGDVIVAVCGELIHEKSYEDICKMLEGYGEYVREVVVSDEGSVQMISVENDEDEHGSNEDDEDDDTESNAAAEPSTLSILLTGDSVQEQMLCRVNAELLQPGVPLYANANALNGQDGIVLKVERASGLVLFSDNSVGEGSNTGVWLPAGCLLLIVNEQYQSWLAEQQHLQPQPEPHYQLESGESDTDGQKYYRKQLEQLEEAAGHRINAQLMDKVASAVLD